MLNRMLARVALAWIAAILASTAGYTSKGFGVVYQFCQKRNCTDGGGPNGVSVDKSGNFYGTTVAGGKWDDGTVFRVTPSGTGTVLYSFCKKAFCADGSTPWSGVVIDKGGNLYGTTELGGSQGCGGNGCGVVFKLTPDGSETVLHTFGTNEADGTNPYGGLTLSGSDVYGTTSTGGAYKSGTVFRVTTAGKERVVYSFCAQAGCTDGSAPSTWEQLLMYKDTLYGTTTGGGAFGGGTVFKLTAGGDESILYSFCSQKNCKDGQYPQSGVIMDKSGNLYGTTSYGSTSSMVFELAPNGIETILYAFSSTEGYDLLAGLVLDHGGNLYGSAERGGPNDKGIAFKISPSGSEIMLHAFGSSEDEYCAAPRASMIMMKGELFGTTSGSCSEDILFRMGTDGGY